MLPEQRRTAAVLAALAALLLSAPRPGAALASLVDAGSSADPTGPLVAAVALLAWAVAGWLALTVTLVLLSRVPGLLGRTARAVGARLVPATVRRAVEAALGLTVAVGALTPGTALAVPAPAPPAAVATDAETAWDLDWPSSAGPPAPSVSTPSSRPSPVSPVPPRRPSEPPPAVRPAATTPTALPPLSARPSLAVPTAGPVVVRAGDTLWSLAEASLRRAGTASPTDRQVAQAWPRWWAANREAVGDDPDLLLPGTVLRPPGTP